MRIGIDLGGTKIEGIALSNAGEVLVRQRVSTPRAYRATIDAVVTLVRAIEEETGERGTVGMGIPGTIVPATGLVKNANSTWLIGEALGRDLSEALAREVRIMNDANCFALSEATDGAGAGADVVFGVILGTGVGGGIVIRGECLIGANLIAGEWGHNALPRVAADEVPGPACYCGRNGCIETWVSGPGFARDHARATGQSLTGPEIAHRAALGDEGAQGSLARYHDRLARALGSVVNVLDPDVIVLGGGMSNLPGLVEAVTAQLPQHVFSDSCNTRVARHMHGDSSGVRGAAWLWPAP
ncbi:MAG: ROK family protein [Gemmatimonadaceae bacterium]|nr:ROK family protein [Gemmatimonadaceae bacterium]